MVSLSSARKQVAEQLTRWRTQMAQPHNQKVIADWRRQIWSPALFWIVAPALGGIGFVYWAGSEEKNQLWIAKAPHEVAAIVLMIAVVTIFAVRSWRYRLVLDYLLLSMAINFLCREIHFAGTSEAVTVIAVVVLALTFHHAEEVLETLKEAPLVRLALTGTVWTYMVALLIQRRVFKTGRIPLLPDEARLHVPLEEVTENIAHLYFLFIGISAFLQLRRRLK